MTPPTERLKREAEECAACGEANGCSCDEVCCCGDSMKGHESQIYCGHTPKSMRAWAEECDRIAIRQGGGE